MAPKTMETAQLHDLTVAFDAMDPDARGGMLSVFEVAPDARDIGVVVIASAILVGLYDYEGVLAFMRRAAVGMPVPDEAEIASLRRLMRGRSHA